MPTIRVNGVINALVHNGGNWFSAATLPDVCKTPTPSGPVPMPYPNMSQVNTLTGGTTTVLVDGGKMAANKPSRFAMSTGDEPGTLGGIKSNVFKQASTWITYSFDVKLEGKNACRFSDKKFQNNENTVDMAGALAQMVQVELADVKLKCGELNEYGKLKTKTKKGKLERDHIPAKATLKARALKMMKGSFGDQLDDCVGGAIVRQGLCIVIPKAVHANFSRTHSQSSRDAWNNKDDLQREAKKDLKKIMDSGALKDKECAAAYKKAAEKIAKITDKQYEDWLGGIIKNCEH